MKGERSDTRHSVTVEIAGERHVLRSDASPEYTYRVAAHVDRIIRSLGTTLEPHRAAILAAMMITDELFRAQDEAASERGELIRRATRLSDLLDRVSGETVDPPVPRDSSS